MRRIYKIALHAVRLSVVDGKIVLLPVRVRHVENARTWLPTCFYTPLRRITLRAVAFVNVTRVFHSSSRQQRRNPFFRLIKVHFIDLYGKTGSRYNDDVTCLLSSCYSVTM